MVKGIARTSASRFNIKAEILSLPVALFASSFLNSFLVDRFLNGMNPISSSGVFPKKGASMHSSGNCDFDDNTRANASALDFGSVSQLEPSFRTGMLVATALRRISCRLRRHHRLLLLGRPASFSLIFCTHAARSVFKVLLQFSLSVVERSVPSARFFRNIAIFHFSFSRG